MSNSFLAKYGKGQQAVFWVTVLLFSATILITLINVYENIIAIVCVVLLAFVMFALLYIVLSFVASGGSAMGRKTKAYYEDNATEEQREMMDNLNRWTWVLVFLWMGILLCYVVIVSTLHLPKQSWIIYGMMGCVLFALIPMLVMMARTEKLRRELENREKENEST